MPEPLPPRSKVTIYTDGGADPNPGPGGWGAVLFHAATGKRSELSGGEPRTTNNRMELTAAIRALEGLKQRCQVHLFTDSQYLRRGVTEWLPGWIARGWRRKDGELQNEDLWRRLAELIGTQDVRWEWIKGHAGHEHNERADVLATEAMRRQRGAPPAAPKAEAEVFLRVSCARGRGAWAALVRRGEEESIASGVEEGESTTPNRLDILGAAAALETLPARLSVAIYTGSDYLRNGARWIEGWQRGGWKTKEGTAVKNRDLWQRLGFALAARKVHWPEVKGAILPELERAGKVAEAARLG